MFKKLCFILIVFFAASVCFGQEPPGGLNGGNVLSLVLVIIIAAWLVLLFLGLFRLFTQDKISNIDKVLLFISLIIFPVVGSILILVLLKRK
ncbi:MAG: hypothetical protein JW881_01545 [Spirochaetales bacterium]|nr:hypothetical protein [Spirochaetales bacterium]